MPEPIQPNVDESQSFEAKELAENIQAGEVKAPEIDVTADYEASKAFSGGASASEAKSATAPKFRVSEPIKPTVNSSTSKGDPQQFRSMAADLTERESSVTEGVSDDLVKKALEKGQPG
ncbi:hypothetical protein NG798_05605 [Ancylothrix sp. C2]|uniref:hypothetical protein n=1 Tax=Ancylothrix sp. D3o TaxID=2953691 RepID=UPI0021BAC422|nr:hypothetical protein [Ancylothrix sp. D3o]MCT7949256.1 hypothetical protein [Ancylothrix sp. D3o]